MRGLTTSIGGFALWLLAAAAVQAVDFASDIRPLLDRYCIKCHGQEKQESGIDYRQHKDIRDVLRDRTVFAEAAHQLKNNDMPPKGAMPSDVERKLLIDWIDNDIINADWHKLADVGRISMSRLTVHEYRSSIRDIFGVDLQAGVYLGQDAEGTTGFTNDRSQLTVPLFGVSNYMREAERVVDAYLGYGESAWSKTLEMAKLWEEASSKHWPLSKEKTGVVTGSVQSQFAFTTVLPHAGMYRFSLTARTYDNEPISAIAMSVNGQEPDIIHISGDKPQRYDVDVNAPAGPIIVSFTFRPGAAPVINEVFAQRVVPTAYEKPFTTLKVPAFNFPDSFNITPDAKTSLNKLNRTIKDAVQFTKFLEQLLADDKVEYETSEAFGTLLPGRKIGFGITASKVALLLDMPLRDLEKKIRTDIGFDYDDYTKAANTYLKRYKEKFPERVKKQAGHVEMQQMTISNHALPTKAVLTCDPQKLSADEKGALACFEALAPKAYRRPVTDIQRTKARDLYRTLRQQQVSHRDALHDVLVSMLIAPEFILRFTSGPDNQIFTVDGFERAARLASFLWLSLPDEYLQEQARNNNLMSDKGMDAALNHVIADQRFEEFCRIFTQEWLNIAVIDGLNDALVEAMRQEPALLLQDIIRNNRSVLDLVNARYTYLNEQLAHHYGIPGIIGTAMRRVELTSQPQRGGLPTMGAILVATSTPQRTSPVVRGAWIVETLLGERLPPPPASVPELKVNAKANTVREELEQHRQAKACAGCHARIDPFGFVLENFDKQGMWRDREAGKPINTSTELIDGTKMQGLAEFRAYATDKRRLDIVRNITERLLEFALGRELQYYDEATIEDIVKQVEADGFRAQTLLRAIIRSSAFTQQNNTASNP